jgi:hypothetical protein
MITGVYRKRNLRGANMMRWSIGVSPPPVEFPSNVHDFSRFIIAWGLTAEGVVLEELRLFLPSQLAVRHNVREPANRIPVMKEDKVFSRLLRSIIEANGC